MPPTEWTQPFRLPGSITDSQEQTMKSPQKPTTQPETAVLSHQDKARMRPLLTYAEAAELLAINPRTLSRRIAAGRYRAYGEGNGRRILI
jgi:excisionase family DNA binding protein